MKTLSLNGEWEMRAVDAYKRLPANKRAAAAWMSSAVPGTVHTDLMAHGVIADPFFRMQENDVQWVDQLKWEYRKTFDVSPGLLGEDSVELTAHGLDTYARIEINGKLAGETADMFVEHRFDVKKLLRPGGNQITIIFDSPAIRAKQLETKHGELRVALEPQRVYVRKAQYSFSWDWGPKLTTSGIWRDIELIGYSVARLRDPFVKVISVEKQSAEVEVSVDIDHATGDSLALNIFLGGGDWGTEHAVAVRSGHVTARVRVPHPRLWWPNGYGDQPLYTAVLTLSRNGEHVHDLSVPFAIRTVRLLRDKDPAGSSFIIEVNGVRIFCKGADWIPSDNFIPRIKADTYDSLLRMARGASMNMIRVWGGGIYEQDIFYTLCDRYGLMVWQDFMFACGEYPEESWFLRQVRDEAEKAVKRLRNHPSIVLWCGNNECEWLFCMENPEKGPDDMRGAKIFRDLLPAAVSEHDGTRPYWRSSPFGDGFPNGEGSGNHHQWTVWSAWKDYPEYEKDTARFVSEFGFQAMANRRTFEEATLPGDRTPQSKVIEHHNKQIEGPERLQRFLSAHYRVSSDFDDTIYKTQLVQANALKTAAEHWRSRKFSTAGVLFWQLNDCWPVSSWSVIDSALRPKAGYFYAKRFFAPVLVSFKRTSVGVEVRGTNDFLAPVKGALDVSLRSFGGKVIKRWRFRAAIGANSAVRLANIPAGEIPACDPVTHYLYAALSDGTSVVSENRLFFDEPKHLQYPAARVTVEIKKRGEHTFVISLKSNAFARNIRLDAGALDVQFDDNYFDLEARATRVVHCRSAAPLSRIKHSLRIRREE